MLENEKQFKKDERERILAEKVPDLQMSGLSLQDLQVHLLLKRDVFDCGIKKMSVKIPKLCK